MNFSLKAFSHTFLKAFQGKFSQQSSAAGYGSVFQGLTLQPAWLYAEDDNTSLRLGKTQNLVVSLSASAGLPVLSSSKQRQDQRRVSDPMAALALPLDFGCPTAVLSASTLGIWQLWFNRGILNSMTVLGTLGSKVLLKQKDFLVLLVKTKLPRKSHDHSPLSWPASPQVPWFPWSLLQLAKSARTHGWFSSLKSKKITEHSSDWQMDTYGKNNHLSFIYQPSKSLTLIHVFNYGFLWLSRSYSQNYCH